MVLCRYPSCCVVAATAGVLLAVWLAVVSAG